ncbi:hypothetical protein C4D60_Mb08t11500 [Musa balbisiana]|uniref:Secreted protein n=1 Tax=Musa balbisiana TaxID=52838 RepID=A0A4S8K319_MUSBA|nr:hypothetical protein C4D60_Mb08t11490 [Musa balbisiana]THU69162.1 hypothetical protein C4D60_Mb08t11500 [Musa balbisiana]
MHLSTVPTSLWLAMFARSLVLLATPLTLVVASSMQVHSGFAPFALPPHRPLISCLSIFESMIAHQAKKPTDPRWMAMKRRHKVVEERAKTVLLG